jgi:hypothetical protein
MIDLDSIEYDLVAAYRARLATKARRRKRAVTAVAALVLAGAFATVAMAADGDLNLDPTKWFVISSGSTDNGAGAYVHAQNKADGSHSTFMVEHDGDMSRYDAFLLHERTMDAAAATSPVPVPPQPATLCTADELTHAEVVALQVVDANPAATKDDLMAALGNDCRGLDYAAEEVLLVTAGTEPRSMLMPGAR